MIVMKCKSYIFLLFLSVLPLTFTACESEPAQIDITLESDYSGMLAAIRGVDKTLSEKLALIESAWDSGLADNQQALKLVRELIAALDGTLEEKLAALSSAMQTQTAGLETKLALVEEAVRNGFADSQAQQTLLQQAVASLGGTMEEKLAAIEAALQSQTTRLETKLGLIEAVARSSADTNGQDLELIRSTLSSLEGTLQSKLAAIDTALSKETAGLETKIALIEAALEKGLLGEKDAVAALQTALSASLDSLDASLTQVKDAIVAQLDTLASQMAPEELAKAFQSIRDAVRSETQSITGLLAAVGQAVESMMMTLSGAFTVSYLGDASYTLTRGKEITVPLLVNPVGRELSKDNVRLEIVESKQFFSQISGVEADHFTLKALVPDPAVEGQFLATVSTTDAAGVWDEAILAFEYNYGTDGHPKFASTTTFQATMMPLASDGLQPWVYRYASLCARDTFYSHNQGRYEADTLGVIYYVFDKVSFQQKNGSETRSYSVDNLDTIVFVPNAGAAPVKTQWVKHPEDSNDPYPYVTFCPDTTGSEQWRNIEHLLYERMDVTGSLVLTDKDGNQTSVPVDIGWYNPHELDLTLNVSVNDKHFVKTGEQPYLPYDLDFGFKYVGLDENLLLACRNNTGYRLDYNSDPLTQQDLADGYIPMTLNWTGTGCEANLIFEKNTVFASGQEYRVRGRIRLKMQPDESSSGFDPRQLLITYYITLNLTD